MANFFSLQDGNLTDTSVYGYSLSTAEVMSNTTGVWLSTVDAYGPSFTGDGSSISAVAVHLSARSSDPTSSILTLKLSSVASTITETYYVSSFTSYNGSNNLLTNYPQNWQILKLTNPYTLTNLSACKLSLATSVTGTLALVCSASNNNYDKVILKQSVVVPTSADNIHIGGSLKGLTLDPRTITATTSTFQNLYIHNGGTLTFPLTSSKTLTLNGATGLQITSDGTLNVGTSSSVIPLSTTHTISLSNNQIDVHNGGNLNVYGYPKLYTTNLASDTTAASNTFTTTDTISGLWNVGDTLTFKPNLTTRNGFDTLVLSGFTGTNTFKTTSNSVYTHTGSATYASIPAIYNLNRNVKIQGISSSVRGTIRTIDAAKTSVNYAQLSNFGIAIGNNNGLFISNNLSGSTTLSGNSFINDTTTNNLLLGGSQQNSAYFNGSNALSIANNAAYCNFGTGDFTIEGWFNYPFNDTGVTRCVFACYTTWASSLAYYLNITSNDLQIRMGDGPTITITHQNKVIANNWSHFSIVRISGVTKLYLNGIVSTTSHTGSVTISNAAALQIARNGASSEYFTGYISNIRILKGTGLYSSNFNPFNNLTSPLSNITNTTLLILTNRYFTDISNTNAAITLVGTPVIYYNYGPYQKVYNITINNNVLYKSYNTSNIGAVSLANTTEIINTTINNNYVLSSVGAGLQIANSTGSINMSNNNTIGSQSYGTYLYNNTLTGTYGATNLNSTLQGMYLSGINTGTIIGGGINSVKEGVYVDTSTSNLSGLSFQSIIANNNSSVGFKVSGNNLAYSNPVILNINGLSSNSNSDAGLEAYNITGNISSVIANSNLSASRISIGNGPTVFDGFTSSLTGNCLNILSATNYSQTVIKNAVLSSSALNSTALNMSVDKLEEFRLEGSTLSATTPFKISTTRSKLEGSYIFHNSNSNVYGLSSLALTGYQDEVFKESGLVVMRENNIQGNHYKYLAAGSIILDTVVVNSPNTISERLTPWSSSKTLRSTSKLIPVNAGDTLSLSAVIQRSSGYSGVAPRLMLVSNPSIGITGGVLYTSTQTSGWETMTATLPSVTNIGAVEVYVDCSGNVGAGYINIDSWYFN